MSERKKKLWHFKDEFALLYPILGSGPLCGRYGVGRSTLVKAAQRWGVSCGKGWHAKNEGLSWAVTNRPSKSAQDRAKPKGVLVYQRQRVYVPHRDDTANPLYHWWKEL